MSGDSQGWRRSPIASEASGSDGEVPDGSDFDPVEAYLEQLGEGSRRTMREALRKLADWASDGRASAQTLEWHRVGHPQTVVLRKRLAETLAPATANKHLAALRGVLRQCALNGSMSEADYRSAIALPPRARPGSPQAQPAWRAGAGAAGRGLPGGSEPRRRSRCRARRGPERCRAETIGGGLPRRRGLRSRNRCAQRPPDESGRAAPIDDESRNATRTRALDLGSGQPARSPLQPRQQGRTHRAARILRAGGLHRLPEARGRSRPGPDQPGRPSPGLSGRPQSIRAALRSQPAGLLTRLRARLRQSPASSSPRRGARPAGGGNPRRRDRRSA